MKQEKAFHPVSVNYLAVVTTFFKKNRYATWIHTHSKGNHQINRFINNKEMLHGCTDAGITTLLLDSGYYSILLKMWVMRLLK